MDEARLKKGRVGARRVVRYPLLRDSHQHSGRSTQKVAFYSGTPALQMLPDLRLALAEPVDYQPFSYSLYTYLPVCA